MFEPQLNKELFFHLSRYHKVIFPPEINTNSKLPSLVIEDSRPFQIEGNRKYLKLKLFEFVENTRPNLVEGKENIANTYKTIKHFIEQASKIKK